MDVNTVAALLQEGGKLITGLLSTYGRHLTPPKTAEKPRETAEKTGEIGEKTGEIGEKTGEIGEVTLEETLAYQCRELAKELTLLEGHLVQGCKISGKPCDCCEKHPIKIEGLAQEAAGMTDEPLFIALSTWTKKIAPITTAEASASGDFDDTYPQLAAEAREYRKAVMGKGGL